MLYLFQKVSNYHEKIILDLNKLLGELSEELEATKKELAETKRQLQSANSKVQSLNHKGIDFCKITRQLSHYADLVQLPGYSVTVNSKTPPTATANSKTTKQLPILPPPTQNSCQTLPDNTVAKKK